MSNFHPLEVVGRGSETQLQVGENLNYLIIHLKGSYIMYMALPSFQHYKMSL